jgi:hypothetical protein
MPKPQRPVSMKKFFSPIFTAAFLVLMTTFSFALDLGTKTTGGSTGTNANIVCNRHVSGSGGAISYMFWYGSFSGTLRTAIYSHNPATNNPDQLLAQSTPTVVSSLAWYRTDINFNLQPNTTYWLCAWGSSTMTYYYVARFDVSRSIFSNPLTPGSAWPTTLVTNTTSARDMSIYASDNGAPPAGFQESIQQQQQEVQQPQQEVQQSSQVQASDFGPGTEAVSIIRQDCAGYSNCYTSLSAWASAKGGIPNGDLIAANKIAVARIEGPWTKDDMAAVSISGWKTDPQHYIHIYTTSEARHKGVEGTGYRIHTIHDPDPLKNKQPFFAMVSHIRVDGIEVFGEAKLTSSVLSIIPPFNTVTTDGDVRVSNNIVHGMRWLDDQGKQTGCGAGISVSSSGTSRVYNNIIYEVAARAYEGAISTGDGTNYVYNNTVGETIDGTGIRASDHTGSLAFLKNNLVHSQRVCFSGVIATGSDYNVCDGVPVPGDPYGNGMSTSGPHDVRAVITFVNAAIKNYKILPTDTLAKDKGVNLTFDESLGFTTDIEGQTRYGQWDIGADEFSNGLIPADIQPPQTPGNLRLVTAPTSDSVQLIWSAASDNVATQGYRIYRNEVLVNETNSNQWTDNTVLPLNKYFYKISAYDSSFNESPKSNMLNVTTPYLEDKVGPHMVIIRVKVENQNSAVITWTSDEYSTSQVEYGTTISYGNLTPIDNNFVLNHSVRISGLSPTTYHYRVRTKDALGNESVSDNHSFTIDLSYPLRTVYVDSKHPNKADTVNNGSESAPYATIQYAYERSKPGDTILVKPGNYGRTLMGTSVSGRPGYWITIKGVNPPDKSHIPFNTLFHPTNPVFTPGNPAVNAVSQGFDFYVSFGKTTPTEYFRIENFEIVDIGQNDGAVRFSAQTTAYTQDIDVFNNLIHDTNPTGVYPSGQHSGGGGIRSTSDYLQDIYIKNNIIFRVAAQDIVLQGKNWLAENNDASHNISFNTKTGAATAGDSDAFRFFGSGHIIRNNYMHHINGYEARGHMDCFQTFSGTQGKGSEAHHVLVEGNLCEAIGQMLMSEDQWEDELKKENLIHSNVFRNNIFLKAEAQAFHFANASDHYTFINNIVAYSGYGSLGIAGNAYNTTALNNILFNNGSGTTISEPNSKKGSVMDHNLHYPDFTNPVKQSEFDQKGLFGQDPLFVNAPKAWILTDDNGPSTTDTGTYDGSNTSFEVNSRNISQFTIGDIIEFCNWAMCDGVARKITSISGNVVNFTPAIAGYTPPTCTNETTLSGYNDRDFCSAHIQLWGNKPWAAGAAVPPMDFHLKEGSPAIGKGTPWAGLTVDKDAKPRTGSVWDIGPYNYVTPEIPSAFPKGSGDVSNDGRVSVLDAAMVLRYTMGASLTDLQKAEGDIDGNGSVNGTDAMGIARKALGL